MEKGRGSKSSIISCFLPVNKSVLLIILLFFCLLFVASLKGDSAFAAGAVINTGGVPSSSTGGGGVSDDNFCNSHPTEAKYLVECTGVSWIYYRSTGNKVSDVKFTPVNEGADITIAKECSAHTDDEGGFWHFGRNAKGFPYGGYADYTYVQGLDDSSSTYYGSEGKWGHASTYTPNHVAPYSDWIKTKNPTPLAHNLYKNGTKIYYASGYTGPDGSGVLHDYKIACEYSNSTNGTNYSCNSLPGDIRYFCYWKGMEIAFEGKSVLSGAASATAGYTNKNTTRTGFINNCSATSGCKVSFSHNVKRKSGSKKTPYIVSRSSNLIASTRAIALNANVKSGQSGNNSGERVSSSGPFTLYPGMVVCEKLTFGTGSGSSKAYTQVCASALGNAQGDQSLLDMKVKNDKVGNTYKSEVYAKPGDTLTFKATYNPILQYTYNLRPQKMRIDSGTIYPTNGINSASTLGAMFNSNKNNGSNKGKGLGNWNNSFSVQFSTDRFKNAELITDYKYTVGEMASKSEENSAKGSVTQDNVGKYIEEKAITNINNNVKTTPSQVAFSKSDDNNLGNVITAQKSAVASALVPYNFKTWTGITTKDDTLFYAGETQEVTFDFIVQPKENKVTEDTYVTKTDAKWRIRFCTASVGAGICTPNIETEVKSGTLMPDDMHKEYNRPQKITIGVPDVKAGSRVCLQSMVYPNTSGVDTNLSPNGDGKWNTSDIKCFDVAKKPSMQILGGNIYSAGNINTATAIKGHVEGVTTYKKDGDYSDSEKIAFGSWGELGIISNGSNEGLASGARLAYANNVFGGKGKVRMCDRSPLSFPNQLYDLSKILNGLGNTTSVNRTKVDKSAILSKYMYGEGGSAKAEPGVEYQHGDGALEVGEQIVSPGTVRIFHSNGNIFVSGNINYNAQNLTSLKDAPKLILYAEQNIYIGCDVGEIDGVLIANHEVKTCANANGDEPGINERERSNRLTINGAVITGKFTPNRTYGAATGVNSAEPAEIINFDPTLYLWGDITTSDDSGNDKGSGNLNMGPIKEMAPRL